MADWISMWDEGYIPWHNDKVASGITKYIEELTVGDKQARVLMPLCGKSLDMKWLADQGYTVIGVELAETAAKQFYEENNYKCTQQRLNDDVIIYEGVDVNVRIVVGDFLSCTSEMCGGKVDAVWDINSLVAMPMDNWNRYVDTCVALMKPKKRILLSTMVYDEAERGPEPRMPYNVPTEKIKKLYGDKFDVQHLEDIDFLYFIKEEAMKEGWTPSKLDQSVHLLTLKN